MSLSNGGSPSSPVVAVKLHHGPDEALPVSTPSPVGRQSPRTPSRQHHRIPSVLREVKETLNAHSEYMSDDEDGSSHHRVNQYEIIEEIGRGSYGAVHLATDQFGNEYAMKEFSKSRLRRRAQSDMLRSGPRQPHPLVLDAVSSNSNPAELRDSLHLIRAEIAIMKKLNHPNLVQLIEVLDDPEDDSLYMVLEMCKKGVIMKVSLDKPAPPIDEELCRCWFRDLLLGIEYLHSQGVIHRDIKPENLLLSEDDVLKIVDFGVSEMFEKPGDMRTAKSAGSPAFLPPELCTSKHGDVSGRAADIWSMGVTLYCLRYGCIPFRRQGVLEMYRAIKSEPPSIPDDENIDLKDLFDKILRKDPNDRITMDELRSHPWVTYGGTDLLLSKEDNCAKQIEPPNALEVNRAITRKMNHLMCVMKSIHKFKALLTRHRLRETHLGLSAPNPDRSEAEDAEQAKTEDMDIEALVQQRRSLIGRRNPSKSLGLLPATTPSGRESRFLRIGTGCVDEFAQDGPLTPDAVAESPTAVDFDVYDRAYEAEVERIVTAGGADGRTSTMYMTRHVRNKSRFLDAGKVIMGG